MTRHAHTPAAASAPAAQHAREAAQLRHELRASHGQALDTATRTHFEAMHWAAPGAAASYRGLEAQADAMAHGGSADSADFSQVRVHRDAAAQRATALAGARALTQGNDVYLGATAGHDTNDLLLHELAHTRQQAALGRAFLQPRLIATGSAADVNRFLALAEPAMGEDLEFNALTGRIEGVRSLSAPATSPAFARAMHRILDDAVNHAEVRFGDSQPGVAIGAFPNPVSMTGSTFQRVDLDDIESIEAGAPGNGLALLAHELTENYEAHVAVNAAGGASAATNQFPPAHAAAIETESDVAEDTVGPGRRVAEAVSADTAVLDFETYFLVMDLVGSSTTAGTDFATRNARRRQRDHVFDTTVDGFTSDGSTLPATAGAFIGPAAAVVLASPTATVRIEGFTDNQGSAAHNRALGRRRALAARDALVALSIEPQRIHTVGRGAVNFVAPNDTDANRARNRRVVISADRPQP